MGAALELFLERGYDEPSINEITKRADLGAGTYYLHFKDKRGLYEALVRRELGVLRQRWMAERTARELSGDPREEIALMVEMVLEALLADRARATLILLQGPPLETWLVEDVGRQMAEFLGESLDAPELVAHLVIGATLNAGRWALTARRAVSTKRLVSDAVAFCAAGVGITNVPKKKRSDRR